MASIGRRLSYQGICAPAERRLSGGSLFQSGRTDSQGRAAPAWCVECAGSVGKGRTAHRIRSALLFLRASLLPGGEAAAAIRINAWIIHCGKDI